MVVARAYRGYIALEVSVLYIFEGLIWAYKVYIGWKMVYFNWPS